MGVCDGDSISRQAAIEALKEKVFSNLTDEFYGAMQVLDELPSAQRWIPITEQLPEDDRYALVTTVGGDVTEAKYWQEVGLWVKGLVIMSVTAWMPLPKPYRKEEEK